MHLIYNNKTLSVCISFCTECSPLSNVNWQNIIDVFTLFTPEAENI